MPSFVEIGPVVPEKKNFFFFFFGFSFTSLSSFFTHIETNQSVGGAKTGVPGEKPPDIPASRTWLVSHIRRILKGFYHIWAWQPSRSCDLDYL